MEYVNSDQTVSLISFTICHEFYSYECCKYYQQISKNQIITVNVDAWLSCTPLKNQFGIA